MLGFVDIQLGDVGGAKCIRCHPRTGGTVRTGSEVVAEVTDVCRAWQGPLGPNLNLTGGEPLSHPALREILTAAVEHGAQRVRLHSDCAGLAAPEVADEMIGRGVRHLRFDLLGADAEMHDALVGVRGAHGATNNGVRLFTDAAERAGVAAQVSARIPVCRHNVNHVPGMVVAATEAGASPVLLAIDDPGLDVSAAAPWLEAGCDTGMVNAVWVEVEGVPYGLAPGWELHLASNYRELSGTKPERCRTCALDDVCAGAMPGASEQVLGRCRPPANAVSLAAAIRRGFLPPASEVQSA